VRFVVENIGVVEIRDCSISFVKKCSMMGIVLVWREVEKNTFVCIYSKDLPFNRRTLVLQFYRVISFVLLSLKASEYLNQNLPL